MNIRNNKKGRGRACRWCNQYIENDTYAVGLVDMKLAGKRVSAFFHDDCWRKLVTIAASREVG